MTVCSRCLEARALSVDCPKCDHCRGLHCTLACTECVASINLGSSL